MTKPPLVPVNLCLEADLHAWLQAKAQQLNQSIEQLVNDILRADQQGQDTVKNIESATVPNTAKTPVITDEDLLAWQKECNIACL